MYKTIVYMQLWMPLSRSPNQDAISFLLYNMKNKIVEFEEIESSGPFFALLQLRY
jgi:hypothetical protein